MELERVLQVWLVLMGPFAGSFVAAVADRTCRGVPLGRGRSACASCGATVAARDLVPVVSYLVLRGRCRACRAPIPVELPLAEVAGGAMGVAAVTLATTPLAEAGSALFLWSLLGLFLSDRRCLRLPTPLNAALLAGGLAVGSGGTATGLGWAALSAVLASAILAGVALAYRRVRHRDGMGAGDIRMIAGIGAAVGIAAIPVVTLVAACTALAWAALDSRGFEATRPLPFGCALAVAGAAVWAWG
jgi:leader peptidase (prepilin peptidase)/N-methyltransferase